MKRLVIAVGVVALGARAHAGFYEPSYTERVISWNSQIDAALQTFKLDPKVSHSAKRLATGWFFLGPCRGKANLLGDEIGGTAISVVTSLRTDQPYAQAVLTMIGIMTRESLGREPLDDLCQYALDIAKSH